MTEHTRKQVVLMLGVVLVLTGCRTPRLLPFIPGLRPAPATGSLASPGLKEITKAFRAAFADAQDDAGRLALAEQCFRKVEAWHMQHPDAPAADRVHAQALLDELAKTRARLEFYVGRAEAQAAYDGAETTEERLVSLDRGLRLTRSAIRSGAFSAAECADMDRLCENLLAAMAGIELEVLTGAAVQALATPVTFDATARACRTAIARIEQEMQQTYWTPADREWLAESLGQLSEGLVGTQKEFGTTLDRLERAVEAAQKQMVNETAKADYSSAKRLYRAQDDKWFNWRILSRPRDNTETLVTAVLFCNRVVAEERVDYPLRRAASGLHADIQGRFDKRERLRYRAAPVLPSYRALAQYPRASADELRAEAERQWLNYRQGLPSAFVEAVAREDETSIPTVPGVQQ